MKTKSEFFVENNRESWKNLLDIIKKINSRGIKKLSADEAEIFPRLYRKTCRDLAEARMLELSPDVLEYLNNLTGQAHHILYFVKPLTSDDFLLFLKRILPFSIVRNIKYVILAVLLFWGSAAAAYFTVLKSPSAAENFMSSAILNHVENMYRESAATGRTGGERAHMSAFYIQHNTSIAFLCFATGIFFGIGSIYFLLYNGVFLGSITAYLTAAGLGPNIWEFITAHSFLELNAIAVSGAAGIMLGTSLLKSWQKYSFEYLNRKKSDILTLVAASAVMLFFAALIEGNISPAAISYNYKVYVLIISAALCIFYFIIYPVFILRKE